MLFHKYYINKGDLRYCQNADDFNTRNKVLTANNLKKGYRLPTAFSQFYRRVFEMVFKNNVGLKTLLLQGLS